jgi:hypothetical protein
LANNTKEESLMYASMVEIFKRIWFHLLQGQDVPAECLTVACIKCFLPEVEKHLNILKAVMSLNKKVHMARYTEIIVQASL